MSVPATTSSAQMPAKAPPRSVLVSMASRYSMEPAAFEATLRGTVFPTGTREEFAAFLVVALEYKLNPLTRQIYAFPKKGGGIVPVVGIDGWIHLVNSHPQFDGMEFEFENDDQGRLISCTCRMHRKDRSKPVVVTEYLEECIRQTDPWKMKRRMLRHKAMIQGARYAFGFSGIHDEDEARDIAESIEAPVPVAPPPPPGSTKPTEPQAAEAASPVQTGEIEDAQIIESGSQEDAFDADGWLKDDVEPVFAGCKTEQNVDEAHAMFEDTVDTMLSIEGRQRYQELHEAALTRVTDAAKTAAAENGADSAEEEAPAPTAPPPAAAATGPQNAAPPASSGPAMDDDDEPAPEPTPPSPADAYRAKLETAIANPNRTSAGLRLWWDDNKPERVELKKAGHITQDDVKEMHGKLTAAYNDAFAKEREEADQLRPDGTDPQKSEPASTDPIAVFDREYREKIAGITSVTELHAYVESTLKTRNALGVDQAQVTEWRKVKTQRQNELTGIA